MLLLQFETTTLFLIWSFVFSLAWAHISFLWKRPLQNTPGTANLHFPAMVLGPLAVFLAYRLWGTNLLFPVNFFATFASLAFASAVPALLICLSSGLLGTIRVGIIQANRVWEAKAFVRFNRANGIDPRRGLRKIVLLQGLLHGWEQSLPWFFCELIVIEIIFNAPGFGLYAWQMARMRNYSALAANASGLALLFLALALVTHYLHVWIGRKLESYD